MSPGASAGHCRSEGSGNMELVWDESTGGRSQEVVLEGTSVQSKNKGSGGVESLMGVLSLPQLAQRQPFCAVRHWGGGGGGGTDKGCLRKPD